MLAEFEFHHGPELVTGLMVCFVARRLFQCFKFNARSAGGARACHSLTHPSEKSQVDSMQNIEYLEFFLGGDQIGRTTAAELYARR